MNSTIPTKPERLERPHPRGDDLILAGRVGCDPRTVAFARRWGLERVRGYSLRDRLRAAARECGQALPETVTA